MKALVYVTVLAIGLLALVAGAGFLLIIGSYWWALEGPGSDNESDPAMAIVDYEKTAQEAIHEAEAIIRDLGRIVEEDYPNVEWTLSASRSSEDCLDGGASGETYSYGSLMPDSGYADAWHTIWPELRTYLTETGFGKPEKSVYFESRSATLKQKDGSEIDVTTFEDRDRRGYMTVGLTMNVPCRAVEPGVPLDEYRNLPE